MAEPSGWVGLDLNEENITAHDSLGNTTVFDIGRIRKAREKYVDKTSRFKRNDVRKRRKVTEKYGAKQKNLTDDVLHKAGPIHHIATRISFCTANFWTSSSLDHHIFG